MILASDKRKQVMHLALSGMPYDEIALRFGLSTPAIKSHIRGIVRDFNLTSVRELYAMFYKDTIALLEGSLSEDAFKLKYCLEVTQEPIKTCDLRWNNNILEQKVLVGSVAHWEAIPHDSNGD